MKKILFITALIFSLTRTSAQLIIEEGINGVLIETKSSPVLNEIEGSPYLEKDFQPGELVIEGKKALPVFLRYDVSSEIMEIKTSHDDSHVYKLSPTLKGYYIINGAHFIFDQISHAGKRYSGYFILHHQSKNYSLLEKPIIDIKEAQKAKSGYEEDKPAQISIDSEFFVLKDGDVHDLKIKHRDVKKLFGSDKAKAYLDENKIRSLDDLIKFLRYLDQ